MLRCPKCGHDVIHDNVPAKGKATCQGCAHIGPRARFEGLSASYPRHTPNQHWRDPVASSMDGYDE